MTMIMIIAIIAAVIFAVFCVLCVIAIQKSHKDAQENRTRIDEIESQLGLIGELITQTTNRIEQKLERVSGKPEEEINPEEKQPKIQKQQQYGQQRIEEIDDEIDFEEFGIEEIGIDEIGDEVDIDSFLAQYEESEKEVPVVQIEKVTQASIAPVASAHFQGYNIGRSGKKYTASELIAIIEE